MSLGIGTQLWVQALARRAAAGGAFATVARSGDPERGDVVVRVLKGDGSARLYGMAFAPDAPAGAGALFAALPEGRPVSDEAGAEAYLERRVSADPDIWILDIEDHRGRHFLTERVKPDQDPFGG